MTPGDIRDALPAHAPGTGRALRAHPGGLRALIVPGLTHWNHPGFFAYFAITASAPGILAEFSSAALNQQAMLWRTSPAATELEEVALGWLRQLLGLPDTFEGVIYDTASISTLHALAAAREAAVPDVRARGSPARAECRAARLLLRQAHSSVDKAVICSASATTRSRRIGRRRVPRCAPTRWRARSRRTARRACSRSRSSRRSAPRRRPASIRWRRSRTSARASESGCTSTPRTRGAAAMLPGYARILDGVERADSIVVNPHKWLFTPVDLSAFYCRRMDVLRRRSRSMPEYLKTPRRGAVKQPDGHRHAARAPVPRAEAVDDPALLRGEGMRARLARAHALARLFAAGWTRDPDFERLAPVPFSVVCFRARPAGVRGTSSTASTSGCWTR